ncbi:MAG: G5 domain-containing protein [Firmicutes bacterium]|nr:G5 domain-containing protein [Bacillota bacterium]
MKSGGGSFIAKVKAGRTFLTILSCSIALSLVLAGVYLYVSDITSDVTIQIDNKIAPCQSRQETVGEVLSDIGFEVGEYDIVEPSLDTPVNDDTDIRVQRVVKEEEQVEEATDYKTVKEDDASLNKGTTEVARNGKKGRDLVTYLVTYTSGEETAREEIGRKTIKKPVDKIVHVGIRETIDGFAYTRKEVFQATAYTGGGRTATGTRARVGEIAVDPRVIPLGTSVYVEGFGVLRAEDTGGAIKGHIIDIYMSSNSACRRFGRRSVTVYLP